MSYMSAKKNPLGPTGDSVRQNIKRLREARGLSYAELSRQLSEVDRPIPTLGLSRIESGQRRVDADDLAALAVVLSVHPNALLLPHTGHGDVEITGAGTVSARDAWKWANGRRPLHIPEDDDGTALLDFQRYAHPRGIRSYPIGTPAGMEQAQGHEDLDHVLRSVGIEVTRPEQEDET